ncbi:MAG: hypothetical protein Q8O67_24590 [Deltaproteobacteria bacterium]|nr:hypothetical protein [Deltaproteobacteria bacterium]
MPTLSAYCARPLPTSLRIEVFCRVISALDLMLRRRQQPRAFDAQSITISADGTVDLGVGQVAAGLDVVGLRRVVDVIFALEARALVQESCPGAPCVLEHVVAQLRAGRTLPLTAVHNALQPWRSRSPDVDDDHAALAALRRKDAEALVREGLRLASASGPGDAVLYALGEAVRADPTLADAADRLRRTSETTRTRPEDLALDVKRAMHEVLDRGSRAAALRLAAVLYGPGADPQRVLAPLDPQTAIATAPPAQRGRAAALGAVVVVAAAGAGFFLFSATPDPVPPAVLQVIEAEPTPSSSPPPAAPADPAVVPLPGPSIVNVWLEGCADCMPTFEAWQRASSEHKIPAGARVINVVYGSDRPSTRPFAEKYGVASDLRFDVDGTLMVQRTGIATFTTFVIDAGSHITWRGRAVDPGFDTALGDAWRAASALDSDAARAPEAQ